MPDSNIEPLRDEKTSVITVPTLFFGIGTPKRRANVEAMST